MIFNYKQYFCDKMSNIFFITRFELCVKNLPSCFNFFFWKDEKLNLKCT